MADEPQSKSDTVLIKQFFGYRPESNLAEFAEELRALTDVDKKQLGEGIRNGTFTY